MRSAGTADALICTTSLRNSRMICWPSDVLDSWNSKFVRFLNDRSLNICACHCCDVVLLVVVLLLFVEVEQFLVQRLSEQLKILQTSHDMFVFPEPVLSSTDVVQHILDLVAAKRLPTVVLEDSYVSRTLVVSSPYF